MARGFDVHVRGAAEVQRDLRGLTGDIEDLSGPFTEVARIGARALAAASPRRSGRLAGSTRGVGLADRAVVTQSAPYAGPINYGWRARNIRPAGQTRQADRVMEPAAARVVDNGISESIRRRGLT
jgi:hypothetical protein